MANRKQIQLKDLEAGAAYVLQLRAVNNIGGVSAWSPKFTIETEKDTTPPNAPSSLTWQVSGDDFVATWSAPSLNEDGTVVEDLKDYKVTLYDPAVPTTKKHYFTSSERFEFSFAQNKAAFGAPEKELVIEVRSRDLGGNVSTDLRATSTDPATRTAHNGAPGAFTLDAVGERKAIVLSWDGPADYGDVTTSNPVQNGLDIREFDIYRNGVYIATVAGDTYTYNDSDPGKGSHSYFIRARDQYSQENDSNTDSATASGYWEEDTLSPSPPQLVTGTPTYALINDGLEAEASLSWDAPTTNTDGTPYEDHEGFEIRYGENSGGPWRYIDIVDTRINGTDVQQFTENIGGLKPGIEYYWGVRARDRYKNYSSWATTNKPTPADTTAPNTPSTPTASGSTNYVLVSHDMNDDGADGTIDPLPRDTVKLKVYISDDAVAGANFTPDDTVGTGNLEGEIDVVPGIPAVQSFNYPVTDATENAGTVDVWVKVKAVDSAGNVSAASAAGQVDVNLIENVNILDATIEAAKIGSVYANSLVAGIGIINDLDVKANLIVGTDALTPGNIESWDFLDGAEGFRIHSDYGVQVNKGKISAGALEIHDSPNLVDAGYADFEYSETWYVANTVKTGTASISISSSWKRYRAQSFVYTKGAAAGTDEFVHFASGNNIPNIHDLTPGNNYIISCYIYNPGTTAVDVFLRFRACDGATVSSVHESPTAFTVPAGTSDRFSFVFSPSAGETEGHIGIRCADAAGSVLHFDGLQMEEKKGYSDEPSFFKIGGATTIDGGNLSTGTIDANSVSIQGLGGTGRVVIDGGGIGLWNAETGGTQLINIDTNGTFYLRTSDGNNRVQFDGSGLRMYDAGNELIDLNSAGTFTIRTAPSGSRVVLDGSGIRLYDSADNINVNLDAATGDATFTGSIYATGGEIDGNFLVNGTISASKLRLGLGENIISNPGFEDGNLNTYEVVSGTYSVGTTDPRTGAYHLAFDFSSVAGGSIHQISANGPQGDLATQLPVAEGDVLRFSFWVKGQTGTDHEVDCRINYNDSNGGFLTASNTRHAITTSYTKIEVIGVVPSGTRTAAFMIRMVKSGTSNTTARVDDLDARRVDGKIVIGDMQIGENVRPGIVNGTKGIVFDQQTSTENAWVKQSDGRVLFRVGQKNSGGPYLDFDTNTNSLVVGNSTYKSSDSGGRVEIGPSGALGQDTIAMFAGDSDQTRAASIGTVVLSSADGANTWDWALQLNSGHRGGASGSLIGLYPYQNGFDAIRISADRMYLNATHYLTLDISGIGTGVNIDGIDWEISRNRYISSTLSVGNDAWNKMFLRSDTTGTLFKNPDGTVWRPVHAHSFVTESDIRLKDNVQPVNDDFIAQAKAARTRNAISRFTWIDPEKNAAGMPATEELGFIADRLPQELTVTVSDDTLPDGSRADTLGYSLSALCAWQQRIIEQLIDRVESLEERF